jgi:outer membrane protein OmpA-like peptidoglycan-associated protein
MPSQEFGVFGIDKKGLYEINVPAGLGVNIRITDRFGLNIQSNAMITTSDKSERLDKYVSGFTDLAWQHSFGLTVALGKISKGDADHDGVTDRKDACPNTPAGDLVDSKTGCSIDSDKDNIADNKDACPQIAGVFALNGCPDSDGDGIKDSEDKCPNLAGDKALNGCPDADKDGVDDSKDKCPDLFGVAMFFGCPDTDKDSVQDLEDKCPTIPGLVKFAGCPDTDADGIEDSKDNCPSVFGYAAFNGCPEGKATPAPVVTPRVEEPKKESPKKEEPKKLEITDKLPLKPLEFATSQASVRIIYSDTLNSIANIMKSNNNNQLLIIGNADSRGGSEMNKALSLRRARAVQNYLVRKGINRNRLIIRGDGEDNPIDTNETPEGRARNRRVDLFLQLISK